MTATIVDFSGLQKLVKEFKAQSNDRWTITDAGAPTEITLGIEGLFLEQGTKDLLVVKLVTSMVVSHGPGELDTTERILFTYVRQHHIDYWIEDDEVPIGHSTRISPTVDASIRRTLRPSCALRASRSLKLRAVISGSVTCWEITN